MTDTRGRLWTRNFLLMWSGQSISVFGSELTLLVFPLVAISFLDVSSASIPLLALFSGLGTIVGLSILAPLADHDRRRTVLATLDGIRIVALAATAVGLGWTNIAFEVLCAASFTIAACTALYDSVFAALIPAAVAKSALPAVNAWFGGVRSAASIGAGGIGGLLLHVLTAPLLIALDALTYCLAALSLIGLRLPESVSSRGSPAGYLAGFRALRADHVQRRITGASAHFNLFTTAIQSILVVYSVRGLGLTSLTVGLAITIGGAIGLLGIASTGPVYRRYPVATVLAVTFAVPGLAACLVNLVPRSVGSSGVILAVAAIAVLNGVWSICVIVNVAGCETLKQITVEPGLLGRFSAAVRLVTWGVDPVGALLAAGLLLVVDLRTALLLLGAGLTLSCVWILTSSRITSLNSLVGSSDAHAAPSDSIS